MAMWSTCSLLLVAAEPRLEARRAAVEAFLQRPKARRRCDLVRLDARKITGETSKTLRGRPAVLRHLWTPSRSSWSRDNFIKKFGSYRVKTNNGHFDFLRSKEVMTVADYLNAEVSEWNLFFADMAYSLQRDVWQALREAGPLPLEAEGFDARPILSVGVKASSTRSHQHAETYQLLLSGLKAWWLAKPGFELDKSLGDPCEALATAAGESPARAAHELPEEPWLCVQQVGEAVYFGDHFPHATCNLEAFVLGFGAQGLSHGWPALHRAAHSNDLDALQRLVEEGVNLNQRHDQVTPLQRAVTKGHLAAVQRLVAAGAKLRLKDREGKSPGTMAAERGDLPMLRFLAEAQPLKEAGQALIWAALSGHVPVMEFLLSQKASIHATDERGLQPIHFAALESDVSTVAFLVEHGANVSAAGHAAERPIHWAAGVGHAARDLEGQTLVIPYSFGYMIFLSTNWLPACRIL